MMSSTQAVPRRLGAALSPAVGPMMWMQVGRLKSSNSILLVFGRRAISIQTCNLYELYVGENDSFGEIDFRPLNRNVISSLFLSN